MIFKLFSWVRFVIVLVILYAFCYEYLYKKYSTIIGDFDQFNRRDRFKHGYQVMDKLNITVKELKGQQFGSASSQQQNKGVHIGELKHFHNTNLHPSHPTPLLPPKKVDIYQFNFYNWYKFQLTFTDLGYDSYFQFRLTEKRKGSHEIIEKVGFRLPQRFYAMNKEEKGQGLSIDYKAKGIELRVQQLFVDAHYGDMQSDGLQPQPFFHLTPNKTSLTPSQYLKFGSSKTLTKFNFTFTRKDYQLKAHISHVIRHNQCLTSYQNGLLRHKCMGGYGKGKISFSRFLRKGINMQNSQYSGNWERNSYNLDNSRVRTVFVGERYLETAGSIGNIITTHVPTIDLTNNSINLYYPPSSFTNTDTFKSIQIDFIGFNKPQYYSKKDRIQKQRWVGMTLYKPLNSDGSVMEGALGESFLFINGNIHPVYDVEFELMMSQEDGLANGRVIRFWNNGSGDTARQQLTPEFSFQLQIQNSTLLQQPGLFCSKQTYRIDGYWRGFIDQGSLFAHNQTLRQQYNSSYQYGYVQFYQIEGTIKITQLVNY